MRSRNRTTTGYFDGGDGRSDIVHRDYEFEVRRNNNSGSVSAGRSSYNMNTNNGVSGAVSRVIPFGENYDEPFTNDFYEANSGKLYVRPREYGFNESRPAGDGYTPTSVLEARLRARGVKPRDASILARDERRTERYGRNLNYDEIQRAAWDSEQRNMGRANFSQNMQRRSFDMDAREVSLGLRAERLAADIDKAERDISFRYERLYRQEDTENRRIDTTQQGIDQRAKQSEREQSLREDSEEVKRVRGMISTLQKQYDSEIDPARRDSIGKQIDAYITIYGDRLGVSKGASTVASPAGSSASSNNSLKDKFGL